MGTEATAKPTRFKPVLKPVNIIEVNILRVNRVIKILANLKN